MQQIGFALQVPFIPSEDDSVRLLFEVTEGLDFTDLYKTYSTLGRNPAIDPAILFKILIYGCMNKIYSSRDLEKACKRDINFIWLLQGKRLRIIIPLHDLGVNTYKDVYQIYLINLLQSLEK